LDDSGGYLTGFITGSEILTFRNENELDFEILSTAEKSLKENLSKEYIKKKTLNNDNASGMLPLLEFSEEGNPIAKTSGKVVNGVFEVEFFIPKDINFNDGEGRILVYADNFDTAKSQAHDVYANTFIQIGGINPDGINDNTPPKANIYMNNTNFANGGITNRNPQLLACLSDDTGINSTGTGIGHDITAILDGKVIDTIFNLHLMLIQEKNKYKKRNP